jgi:transcriptional regulator with XRE-family HTH domain
MNLLEQYSQDPRFARLLAQEELILEVTETLCALLEKEQVSRAELARRLGKSKGFVSQLLNGGRNLTLRTLADVLSVLGYKLKMQPEKMDGQGGRGRVGICHQWQQPVNAKPSSWVQVSWPDNYSPVYEMAI